MCGIIAIVRRPSTRPIPDAAEVTGTVEAGPRPRSPEQPPRPAAGWGAWLRNWSPQPHVCMRQPAAGRVPGLRLLLELPHWPTL